MTKRKKLPEWAEWILIVGIGLFAGAFAWWLYTQGAGALVAVTGFFFAVVVLSLVYDLFALLFGWELISLEFISNFFV